MENKTLGSLLLEANQNVPRLNYDESLLLLKNDNTVLIDAEDYKIQDKINTITDEFMEQYNRDKLRIYKTYQLYRNDYLDIMKLDILKQRDYKIGFKLVRGAYYNQDKKYNILFDTINDTHDNYNAGISLFSYNEIWEIQK